MGPRTLSLAGAALVAAALVLVTWPQLVGYERAFPVAVLVALRALLALAALVVAVPFVVLAVRSSAARLLAAPVAILLVACAAANVAILSARGPGGSAADAAASVTVLSWNTLGDAPGAEVIARLAIDSGADVVALPETTRETGLAVAALMAAAGSPVQAFTLSYDETSSARSTTLLVSEALGEYEMDARAVTTLVLPTVVAYPVDGDGPTLVAVHTLAPIPPMVLAWQDDLTWVSELCAAGDVILAGDFNATVDHLVDGECIDAALATDNAAVGTWPATIPALLGAPIDHVMATANWRFTGMRVIESHDGYGSDHRPVLAQLTPQG